MQNAARMTAHEQICEIMRRRTDEFMVRVENAVSEIKQAQQIAASDVRTSLERYSRDAQVSLEKHAEHDEKNFKAVFSRFWWLMGAGYGVMLPLVGFLFAKLLHWI